MSFWRAVEAVSRARHRAMALAFAGLCVSAVLPIRDQDRASFGTIFRYWSTQRRTPSTIVANGLLPKNATIRFSLTRQTPSLPLICMELFIVCSSVLQPIRFFLGAFCVLGPLALNLRGVGAAGQGGE